MREYIYLCLLRVRLVFAEAARHGDYHWLRVCVDDGHEMLVGVFLLLLGECLEGVLGVLEVKGGEGGEGVGHRDGGLVPWRPVGRRPAVLRAAPRCSRCSSVEDRYKIFTLWNLEI